MKQEPKTISEKKRIGYVKKNVTKCFHPNLEGEIIVTNIRKYLNHLGMTSYIRYEIDLTFQGKLQAVGPRGWEWYTMKEIKDNPSSYDIRRVNNNLRPKLLKGMKSKLKVLGFDLNYCEIKKIKLV
jgi:hypothetical protein